MLDCRPFSVGHEGLNALFTTGLILFSARCFQVDKVLAVAEDVKNIGNNLFKGQEWKAAVGKYTKALRFVCVLQK